MISDPDIAKQFDEHLRAPRQLWLLGAGVSLNAGIPLMIPLTTRINVLLNASSEPNKAMALEVLQFIRDELPADCHIEHILSHLADLIALSERAKDTSAQIGSKRIKKADLQNIHHQIQGYIRDIVRWGYKSASGGGAEQVGEVGKPIVSVDDHRRFVKALYRVGRAGVDAFRDPVQFITTNYDTLLEDSLSLERLPYIDGFTGGAVAFWSEEVFNSQLSNRNSKAVVTKLHGSIDWHSAVGEGGQIFRVRHDELYPDRAANNSNVVIYPQSTKYTASRLDPFGCMFQHFRDLLAISRQQVLFICGYSFGDDHINANMEQLILHPDSKTTVIVFSKEIGTGMNSVLKRWCQSAAASRIYVATDKGLYRGSSGPNFPAITGEREWWTFSGVAQLLEDGLPPDIAASIS